MLLEFSTMLNKEKNLDIRHAIKKQIMKNVDNSEKVIFEINEILQKYYTANTSQKTNTNYDIGKLIEQVNDYAINHNDKKILLSQIDTTTYIFDKIKINTLKNMPKQQLLNELIKLSKRIVALAKPSDIDKILDKSNEFPNMLSSCQTENNNAIYCKRQKLIITSADLKKILEIMASDLTNPFKSKWIFSPIFVNNTIEFLKFIKRSNESISIEIL